MFSACAVFLPAYRTEVNIVNDRRQVEDCESQGTVKGSSGTGSWNNDENTYLDKATETTAARHNMKHEAYRRNANTILIKSISTSGKSTTITGEAFFCEN